MILQKDIKKQMSRIYSETGFGKLMIHTFQKYKLHQQILDFWANFGLKNRFFEKQERDYVL